LANDWITHTIMMVVNYRKMYEWTDKEPRQAR